MATLRNKRKLAAVSKETKNHQEQPVKNTSVPGITEEYITQVSEKIEGRDSLKNSQEFSRTEFCILGALSKLDEFISSPQARTCFGTVPGPSRNIDLENREPTGDRS